MSSCVIAGQIPAAAYFTPFSWVVNALHFQELPKDFCAGRCFLKCLQQTILSDITDHDNACACEPSILSTSSVSTSACLSPVLHWYYSYVDSFASEYLTIPFLIQHAVSPGSKLHDFLLSSLRALHNHNNFGLLYDIVIQLCLATKCIAM